MEWVYLDAERKCRHCGASQFTIVCGDLTCTSCGLVAMDQLLSFDPEWRNFADDHEDRSRIGCAYWTGNDAEIGTIIENNHGKLSRTAKIIDQTKHSTILERQTFDSISDRINLSDDIITLSKEMLTEYHKKCTSNFKGEHRRLLFAAVSIYYASKTIPGASRTKEEMCTALGLCTKQFSKTCTEVKEALKNTQYDRNLMQSGARSIDMLNRLLQFLPFRSDADKNKVRSTVLKLHDRLSASNIITTIAPTTLMGTIIFMACLFTKTKMTMKAISEGCGISLTTIINTETLLKQILLQK